MYDYHYTNILYCVVNICELKLTEYFVGLKFWCYV